MNDQPGVVTTILSDSSGLLAVLIGVILIFAFLTVMTCEFSQWIQIRLKCRRMGHSMIELRQLEPHMLIFAQPGDCAESRRRRRTRRCYTETAICSRCGHTEKEHA